MAGESKERDSPGRRHIIKRPRLTRILDESNARVLMLVAPAGYGKTTLAREWLEHRRHAWYQGGPASADVAALAVGLAEACATIVPGAGERMRARLRATSSPEQDVEPLAELLAEDLTEWPDDAWLAIDDYQFAMGSDVSEHFVEVIHLGSPMRLLISARDRPTWAKARRLLYSEIHELSRSSLAMDQDEAAAVLATMGRTDASGLLALADGWPAVIGLASFAGPHVSVPDDLPETLYDFFAEELYQTLPTETQAAFCVLAAPASLTPSVVSYLIGDNAEGVVERGEQIGVLSKEPSGAYVMHPLLRTFLLRRLDEHSMELDALADRLLRHYTEKQEWDAAFSLVELCGEPSLIGTLVEAALPDLLAQGRLATLRRWLAHAEGVGIRSATLDLASAELDYREGNLLRAQALAEHTLQHEPIGTPLRPRLLLLAGRAAQLAQRTQDALAHMEQARAESTDREDLYEALWGRFVVAARVEDPKAQEFLAELDAASAGVPDRELRSANARLVLGVRMGSLHGLAEQYEKATPLVPRASDPLIRSSFLVARAQLLGLLARYRSGMKVIDDLEHEIHTFRIDFAIPHASMAKALILLGLRETSEAAALIAYVEQVGREHRDVFIRMNSAALRARLLMQEGRSGDAVRLLATEWTELPEPSMHAEYLSVSALAHALAGAHREAVALADRARRSSKGVEAAVIQSSARAVVALRSCRHEAAHAVTEAFETSMVTANYDGLLLAFRLAPDFLEAVASDAGRLGRLSPIIRDAEDHTLARMVGLPIPPLRASGEVLTPREREVYGLLARGLTNREIAKALFISESTAKVHTVRILEKLGVRSRTEVALHAANPQNNYAASDSASGDHGS